MKPVNPKAEIFSQGEEIVSGQTVDTNAHWLSQELVPMGFDVVRHTTVGDRLDELVALLKEISDRADCCLCTGGLGPTGDDLTAEAVALAFDRDLVTDDEAMRQIKAHFSRMGREMPEINAKQALLPQGAMRLDNDWGTAPGFALQVGRCWFAFVPGVPYEMKNMFRERIKPVLGANFNLSPLRRVVLNSVGIGESNIQQRLQSIRFPNGVTLSFRSGATQLQTKLLFEPDFPEADIRLLTNQVANAIGKPVFWIEGLGETSADLVGVVDRLMQHNQYRLAAVETLSAGNIAARCAGRPWFCESLIKPDTAELLSRFELPQADTQQDATMVESVTAIAKLYQKETNMECVIAQLWCGSEQALHDKTQTVKLYSALATPDGVFEYRAKIGGTAARKHTYAATISLDSLRRYLSGLMNR